MLAAVTVRRAAVRLLSSCVASSLLIGWPAVATAQAQTVDAAPERVSCQDAHHVYRLICKAFELIDTRFVDPVDAAVLAEAAARGVSNAGLSPRDAETVPPCALPAQAFEAMCVQMDAVGDTEAAVWAATQEMIDSLNERNTRLLTADQYESFASSLQEGAPFVGLGLRLGLLDGDSPCEMFSQRCRMVVSEVYPNSPAERAGVQIDDVLLELDGPLRAGLRCGLAPWRQFTPGAAVDLKVERRGRELSFRTEAAELNTPVVGMRLLDDVGYIRLDSFTESAHELVAKELQRVLDAEATTIVLDVRRNPGGYLQTVIEIASMFLNDDDVVTQEVSQKETLRHLVQGHGAAPDPAVLPMLVLVDGSSASASELLTLALRDHGRATVVGQSTYGKNTAQITQPVPAEDGGGVVGAVRLTVARWLGPHGASAADGIEPDVEVSLSRCLHPIALVRQVAAAAKLPGAELADISRLGVHQRAATALDASGVFDGTECQPGLFCGDEPVTRWAAAVWLTRVLDGGDPPGGAPAGGGAADGGVGGVGVSRFEDVDSERWWSAHVERIAELGITLGCSAEPARFCPTEHVNRAQMASFLLRAFDLSAVIGQGFADTSGSVHSDDIDAIYASGITNGCAVEPLRFCPNADVTRAELASLLHRASSLL